MSLFQEIYPFTTENIDGYIHNMDLEGKSLITLGSSLDQAFNALVLGVKNVTVFDINKNIIDYYNLKRDFILNYNRDELYNRVISSIKIKNIDQITDPYSAVKFNCYLQSDDNYNLLRERLLEDNIDFINGNLYDIEDSLKDELYDRMILSNALQYINCFYDDKDIFIILKKTFENLKKHLSDKGII